MKTQLTLLILAAILQTACGRETKIYADPAVPTIDEPNSTDGRSFLPKSFFNQSVNHASVDLLKTDDTYAVVFQTTDESSEAGSFNDAAAKGNMALLGISAFDRTKLSDLKSVSYDATGEDLQLKLIVDLDCDEKKTVLFTVKTTPEANDRHTAQLSSATLTSSDTDFSAAGLKAADVLTKHPKACLSNARAADPNLPNSFPTAALLISLGDKDALKNAEAHLTRIAVESSTNTVYEAADWEP